MVGKIMPHDCILERLGGGGMVTVHSAQDAALRISLSQVVWHK